ncbi:hypothetical protein ABZT06_01735 [Streptomyces sp. NPDC005483]|uniref:hypothetical protein n=1 Tax=Streptomyces sp. NPDC005483 TaxID=3154882 RepID=UPI00339FE182
MALDGLPRAIAGPAQRGRHLLGDELPRVAFARHEARPGHARVRPLPETLAARFGETAHHAVREVVHRTKLAPPPPVPWGRPPRSAAAAVGKVLPAQELGRLDDVPARAPANT